MSSLRETPPGSHRTSSPGPCTSPSVSARNPPYRWATDSAPDPAALDANPNEPRSPAHASLTRSNLRALERATAGSASADHHRHQVHRSTAAIAPRVTGSALHDTVT